MAALLNLGYKSQYDADAGASRNDCGPACLAMILNGFGLSVTTDAVFYRTGAAPSGYVSMAQLMRVGESYGYPLDYRLGLDLGALRGLIDLARPLIALVHYGAFVERAPGLSTQSLFTGPHFVVVTGYDEQHVSVHDPLWHEPRRAEGAFRKWENAAWLSAWGRCHEDCNAEGRCNPDFAALISVRSLGPGARVHIPADVLRRLLAWAAYTGRPQPNLSQPASLSGFVQAAGRWGERSVARQVKSGDTLWNIAKAYYGDGNKLKVIQYFNGLDERDVIHTGQILLIPEPTLPGDLPENRQPVGGTRPIQ